MDAPIQPEEASTTQLDLNPRVFPNQDFKLITSQDRYKRVDRWNDSTVQSWISDYRLEQYSAEDETDREFNFATVFTKVVIFWSNRGNSIKNKKSKHQ